MNKVKSALIYIYVRISNFIGLKIEAISVFCILSNIGGCFPIKTPKTQLRSMSASIVLYINCVKKSYNAYNNDFLGKFHISTLM